MIKLTSKYDCCGCEACAQRCGHNAISMIRDDEGFLYPNIKHEICVDCGLCEKVCPVINQAQSQIPLESYAAYNSNEEIRLNSSSGGIFSLLAEYVINNGGVVFGAKFNENWDVIHDYTETIDGISQFRGSKYLQSRIGNCFILAKQILESGRKVLFSGTPCQIAGLKLFLRKDYPNLLAVDIICHGVPSQIVWNKYLTHLKTQLGEIGFISFRSKPHGWKDFCFYALKKDTPKSESLYSAFPEHELYSPHRANDYFKAFLQNYSLRPSCYACPAKQGKSHSDITIADFWGIQHIHPDFDDNKGCNLTLINSENGYQIFKYVDCHKIKTDYQQAIKYNPGYLTDNSEPKYRKYFFKKFDKYGFSIFDKIGKKQQPSLIRRIVNRCKNIIK